MAHGEGAVANAFRRMTADLDKARAVIRAKLPSAPVIASDETTARVDGVTQWPWVFLSDQAVRRGDNDRCRAAGRWI